MLFWNKKPVENDEPTLKEEINHLKSRLTKLDAELLDVITAQDILRNKVLRKIQVKKVEQEEETQEKPNEWLGIPTT